VHFLERRFLKRLIQPFMHDFRSAESRPVKPASWCAPARWVRRSSLLHGFPQTHLMWRGVAPLLAREFTVVCAIFAATGKAAARRPPPDHASVCEADNGARFPLTCAGPMRKCCAIPITRIAICEEYRAAADIDRAHDPPGSRGGAQIRSPFSSCGARKALSKIGTPRDRSRCGATGPMTSPDYPLKGGHFFPEAALSKPRTPCGGSLAARMTFRVPPMNTNSRLCFVTAGGVADLPFAGQPLWETATVETVRILIIILIHFHAVRLIRRPVRRLRYGYGTREWGLAASFHRTDHPAAACAGFELHKPLK